ncbi:IPT/TIG domain-containing protein [bacterium]|nr:IPT/TIG domain-containing protein [bacterium]
MLQPIKRRRPGIAPGMAVLLAFGVTSCVAPATTGFSSLPDAPARTSDGTSSLEQVAAQSRATDTAIRGTLSVPESRAIQAAPDYAAKNATLTLVSLADNLTIVTGRTNADGTFVLGLNGFSPAPGSTYLLEASRGLNNNAAGNEVARFRTFLTWTGGAWTSVSGTAVVINAQTTAVAVISSLDPLNVPPGGTMNKVSGTSLNASPALTNHPNSEIAALATEMLNYLIKDFDPVRNTANIGPSITTLTPSNPAPGGAMTISGSGFSPIQSGNVVLFGAATASIFTASSTALGVFVPPGAPFLGTVTVKTSLGASKEAASYTLSATGGGGGGGGGSVGGLSVSALVPANGAPGDSIMIRGTGFSPVLTDNVVKFAGVDAEVTYADSEMVVAKVPAGAASGPMTITVGGVTKGFFFNFTVPIIASFNPNTGNELTSVTVNGQNFATQGPQSKIRFNGVPSPNITSWFGTQAVGLAPPPSLSARISGPLTVQSDAGIISQSGGPFTARQNVVENFATTNQRNAGTNAAWGSNALQPAAAVTTFTQTNFSANTNVGVLLNASNQVTVQPLAIAHTGQQPGNSWCAQLGVDGTSYFINNGGTVYRYSLLDGSLLGTRAMVYQSSSAAYVYLASENAYAEIGGNAASIYKFNAFAGSYISGGFSHTPFMASNGTHYLLSNGWGSHQITNTSFGGVASPFSLGTTNFSAAGFTGSSTFLYKDSAAATITTLMALTYPSPSSAATSLPFSIGSTGLSNIGSPTIGSNGTHLFILGSNAAYNGGALSLFKFNVSGSAITLGSGSTGTSVTSAISLPASSLWDTVTFNRTLPAGTTLTVDVLDGATNAVLMSNVSIGASLNGITAASIKLRANLTGAVAAVPVLTSWSVTTRPSYAISNGYDTGTNYGVYETPVITANNANYAFEYSDSADNSAWGSWVSDITTLSRRYIRYRVNFSGSNTQITRITLPYTY